jgi:hypothetical protein
LPTEKTRIEIAETKKVLKILRALTPLPLIRKRKRKGKGKGSSPKTVEFKKRHFLIAE